MMNYPFSAIVGQEAMKLALILCGINPRIGGVLISGGKGSGKSSAARGLAAVLPSIRVPEGSEDSVEAATPFVTLPLGATEDRVLGTIDLERAMRDGQKRFEPGLLARANRGILYVDEVNLLPDHLVDVLLDVAASGVNVVEREGVSTSHPAKFILVGTMNPDEGELRPQLLDRFGLSVQSEEIGETTLRAEVARRVVAYEADPEAFASHWAADEAKLRERIARAQALLPSIVVPASIAQGIAARASRENVEGLRADLVIQKAGSALAAWEGRREVSEGDVERVAELALAHRRRPPSEPPTPPRPKERDDRSSTSDRSDTRTPTPAVPRPARAPEPPPSFVRPGPAGSRSGAENTSAPKGPWVRSKTPDGHPREIALDATLRAACLRGSGPVKVRPEDLREKVRETPVRVLYLFVLDASLSMGARRRMEATKGALVGVLEDAYRKRDEVGLVTFQGEEARVALVPTRSVKRAERCVRELPVGGRTPLAQAIRTARGILTQARRRSPDLTRCLVLVSDGRPTVGLGGDPLKTAERELTAVLGEQVHVVLVDTEEGAIRLGILDDWARRFDLERLSLDELSSRRIRRAIRAG